VYQSRNAAWYALYELELSIDNRKLIDLAREAINIAYEIRSGDTVLEMNIRADNLRESLSALVAESRMHLNPG
jgi:hypothetical protein